MRGSYGSRMSRLPERELVTRTDDVDSAAPNMDQFSTSHIMHHLNARTLSSRECYPRCDDRVCPTVRGLS
jgi:hypothetical protein